MKNIRDYIDKKYAVQCSSEEEWQKIMDLAPDRLFTTTNYFNNSLVKLISLNDFGTYWSSHTTEQIEADGYTILPASDFLIVDMTAIQEEAKKRFPIGCKFKNTNGGIISELKKDEYVYHISENNNIWASKCHGLLYEHETGKWAELISLPEETKKKMFYKGDYIVTLINDGDCGKVNYCSKQRENSLGLKPVIDTKGYHDNYNSEFLGSDTSNTKWRYATPEEIAEYERIGKPYDVTTLHKQPNFVVGKWYKYNNWYIKYSHTGPCNVFVSSEEISPSKVHEYCKSMFGECNSEKVELTDLSEIQQYLPEGHPDKIVKPKSLVGRYLKALVNNPSGGSNVNKGDYGVIVDSYFANFPNNKGYSCSAAIIYFTENPNEQFCEDRYELMPEGFKPDPNEEYITGSLSYTPPTNLVITNVGGGGYETLSDLYHQQEQPHIVNVQTTCVNLRTKTKNKYLTL